MTEEWRGKGVLSSRVGANFQLAQLRSDATTTQRRASQRPSALNLLVLSSTRGPSGGGGPRNTTKLNEHEARRARRARRPGNTHREGGSRAPPESRGAPQQEARREHIDTTGLLTRRPHACLAINPKFTKEAYVMPRKQTAPLALCNPAILPPQPKQCLAAVRGHKRCLLS